MNVKRLPFAVAALSAVLRSWGAPAASVRLVDIGTHMLQMRLAGEGFPVIVLDAGITDGIERMMPLQDRLALAVRVVAYDRAGYGGSDPGPLPRDSGREAAELKALLEAAGVPGPYIVVGHSLGGLNAQVFAAKSPRQTAGLVLLDPPPITFLLGKAYAQLGEMALRMTAEWQGIADAGAEAKDPGEKAKAAFFRMIASEHREMFGESARLASDIPSFGELPLLVMAAGVPNPRFGDIARKYQDYWIAQSRDLSRKSSKGRFILAERCTHYLYVDDLDLVAREILSFVDAVRESEILPGLSLGEGGSPRGSGPKGRDRAEDAAASRSPLGRGGFQ